MKRTAIAIFLIIFSTYSFGQANLLVKEAIKQNEGANDIEIRAANYYKYRSDGKPGRGVVVKFNKTRFKGKGTIEVDYKGQKEVFELNSQEGLESYELLLFPDIAKDESADVRILIHSDEIAHSETISIPSFRHWEVLIYPHSHVDIGYTNTHANVELIHTRNVVNGLELAKKTKDYPDGAKYKWNPEVIWPVERYLAKATEEEKQAIMDGIKDGYLPLDAGYVNLNTTLASEEELFEFFRQGQEYKKKTGQNIETLVQVDIPGMTWGMIPIASKLGIKYVFSFNNGYDRVGWSTDHNFKPFWWSDKQGENKLLYLQPGSYNPGALIKGKYFWPEMAGQTDPDKLIEIVKTDNPRENFIDSYLDEKLPELENADYYPYTIFPMSWAMADNTPIDADLPEAVKSWNEEYAYPRLKIVSATEIMREFDERYGDQLPTYKGDFTEFWTDGGAGTAAKQTAQNRASKERLEQAETLWTMLKTSEPAPRKEFNEAWRNILMGSEHTWCYMNPYKEPINSDILETKFAFFDNAENESKELLLRVLPEADGEYVAVFNNLSWSRGGIVRLPAEMVHDYNGIIDGRGKNLKAQKLTTGELVFMSEDVPAFGSKKYSLTQKALLGAGSFVNDNVLDNGIVRVEVSEKTGDIVSLKLKDTEFVNPDADCAINSFRYLKADDSPDKAFATTNIRISIKEDGPLMATLRIEANAEGCNKLVSEITIYEGLENVEIKNIVDKIATVEKEGVHFGFAFDVDNPKLVADIPWGTMEIEKDQLPGANRNWITLQRWLDIANGEKGVTWCPIEAPLFQVGEITANILGAATESEQWIRKLSPSGTIYSWALNNHWHTNFQLSQGGEIVFRYHILPRLNEAGYARPNQFGIEQHQPLVAAKVNKNFKNKQLLELDGSPLVLSTVFKTSEDGKYALLRLRSISAIDEQIDLIWPDKHPSIVQSYDIDSEDGTELRSNRVIVPANDFITLKVVW
tara:strand:+ start:10236 stop:13157 length:2922 start_codon:yes stop_codon:yes gene_type:complete